MERIPDLKRTTISLSGLKLNLFVLLLAVPLWLLVSGLYVFIFGPSQYVRGIVNVLNYKIFILLFLGIVIHELLHALTWMLLQKEGFSNIKFGFNWHSLTPYTHYTKPLVLFKYRWGGIMPGLLMGILPAIISYAMQNASLNFVSFLFVWAASGDIISLWMLRKLKPSQMVQDHPDELGVMVLH